MAKKQEQPQKGGQKAGQEKQGEGADLKSREYKDAQGNVHHHTRTYQEQHNKD